jgi:transcriptional regulator
MINSILTQNKRKLNLERDAVIFQLRLQGLTYQKIADMFKPPVTRQAVHIAIKRYLRRKEKTKADAQTSA